MQYSAFNISSPPQMNRGSAMYKRTTDSSAYFKANVTLLNSNCICFLAIEVAVRSVALLGKSTHSKLKLIFLMYIIANLKPYRTEYKNIKKLLHYLS